MMGHYTKAIKQFCKEYITLHMYSDPNFVTEIFVYCILLLLYSLLTVYIKRKSGEERSREIGKKSAMERKLIQWMNSDRKPLMQHRRGMAYRRYSHQPNRANFEESETQIFLNRDLSPSSSTISHYSAKSYVDENYKRSMVSAPSDWIFCSPQTYLQRAKLEREMGRNISKESLISLSTICGNVINKEYSWETLNNRIDLIREEESCNAMKTRKIMFRDKMEVMTESVFDLIESYTNGERKCPNGVDVIDVILEASDKKFKNSKKSRKETVRSNALLHKYFDQRSLLNIREF